MKKHLPPLLGAFLVTMLISFLLANIPALHDQWALKALIVLVVGIASGYLSAKSSNR